MIDLLNHYGYLWAEFFGAAVIQNTIFLGLVFAALYFLRDASAQIRYVVGLIGLFKLLLPPFFPIQFVSSSTPLSLLSEPVATLVLTQQTTGPENTASARPDFLGIVFALWIVFALGYVVFAIISTLRIVRSLRGATQVSEITVPSRAKLGTFRLFKSPKISVPLTVGVFPKKIFVPHAWEDWSPECRNVVLRHETAHIARHDGLVQVFQILAQALYFFHPLVWLLNRRLREYREMACDDSSVGIERFSRLEFSKNLVELAETVARDPLACDSVSALMRRKNELLARVRYQMKEGIMRTVSKKRLAFAFAVLLLCVVPLSWYVGSDTPAQSVAEAGKKSASDVKHIEVSIENAEKIRIGNQPTNLENFERDLKNLVEGEKQDVVIALKCADDLPVGVLFKVQRVLVANELVKVKYEHGGPAMPLVLPSKELETKMKEIPEKNIVNVYVSGSGEVVLDEKKSSLEKLSKVVDKSIKDNPLLIVSIHAKGDVPYKTFVSVLREVKKGNATRIFINIPKG
ncbi:MAG: biopolymer transporter ExbD [Candidatus Latescibacterota bacterium]|nr:MAG: biopolymer transporter ExbD [Candidatus Latescibacterota bacterium]